MTLKKKLFFLIDALGQRAEAPLDMIGRRKLITGGGAAVILTGAGLGIWRSRSSSMAEYEAAVAAMRSALKTTPELPDLIRFATLAANSHNTQPWKFKISDRSIETLPDLTRQIPVADPDNHHLFASLGCAATNLALAAAANGKAGEISFNAANGGSVTFTFGSNQVAQPSLVDAITKRQSTRAEYDGRQVGAADVQQLASVSAIAGVDVMIITDRPKIDQIRDLVISGNTMQMADAAFVKELKSWIRFNPRSAMTTGDGLFSATNGNPTGPDWLAQTAFDWFYKPKSENDKLVRQINSSAGLAVFVSQKDDPEHWVLAGRACQRFALQATALGIKTAFINQPVEVPSLRPELANLVGLAGRRPDILMRFGYGAMLPYSARRPVANIIA
jgi:nitroreductase